MNLSKRQKRTNGFTLLEMLLVVAIIAILAGIVIVAINPAKQLGDTRNAQRKSDVATILSAVYQFEIDHSGALPGAGGSGPIDYHSGTGYDISDTAPATICNNLHLNETIRDQISTTTPTDANAQTYLYSDLVPSYLTPTLPSDPSRSAGSGYYIFQNGASAGTGPIFVCAYYAENGASIYVVR